MTDTVTTAEAIEAATATATASVRTAEANHAAAVTKAAEAARTAENATNRVAQMRARLQAGDSSVDIVEMVDLPAQAERASALAIAYNDAIPGIEGTVRHARTAEVVAKLGSGVIRSRDAMTSYVEEVAGMIADSLLDVEAVLDTEATARYALSDALPNTTAYGSGYAYRNGSPYSPIRVSNNETYEVDGVTYEESLSAERTLQSILSEAGKIVTGRITARREPARLAAMAARAAQSTEAHAIADERRDWSNGAPTHNNDDAPRMDVGRLVFN